MSLEAAAITAAATPIAERLFACIWDNNGYRRNYLAKFQDNYKSLMTRMSELRGLSDHVKRRVEVDEASQQMKCTPVVAEWLERVEVLQQEVDMMLQECSCELRPRGCGDCYPKSWWTRYKLCKRVVKKLEIVAEIRSQGNFEVVADRALTHRVLLKYEGQTVGMDGIFTEVWNLLADDAVKSIGIYGMGGVGKTTLLKKINNAFLRKDGDRANQTSDFDVIIWVTVSSQLSILDLQKEIGKRLGISWSENDDENEKAERILNVLSKKSFVILLDDIWVPMDFEAIGVPSHLTSKVVFTTRSEKVCGEMEVSKKIKVPVLDWDQAWILFQQKLGQEVLNSHPEIPEIAESVVRKCHGLPLALITIGRAMSSKKTLQEWCYAERTLAKYASEFSGMEEKVLAILKFSYDSLEDDTCRDCFLSFSLFPEDLSIVIKNIVYQWLGEGFLGNFEDMDDAVAKGYDIIGNLKASSLLEMGDFGEISVKMHDVVRDLALWIASECGKKKNKFLVQAGVGLTQAPKIERWNDAERVSLMDNDIKELSGASDCPHLLTLLLENNSHLSIIPHNFLQYMPNLGVLDLSATGITELPKSIGGLLQLQFLDLYNTKIETLPYELGNLVTLKYLNLGSTYVETIPSGIIPRLLSLQVLEMSGTHLDGSIAAELESLEQLRDLGITITEHPSLLLSDRLNSYIRILLIDRCQVLTELALLSPSFLRRSKRLRELGIVDCLHLEKLTVGCVREGREMGLLLSLEELYLIRLPKLNDILWAETATHLHFKQLSTVYISGCGALKDISWLVLAPSLSDLHVQDCQELEEIVLNKFSTRTRGIFSRVLYLHFNRLPKLKSISLPFPSLKEITVSSCPLLKKLPFASNNINSSMVLFCKREWWNESKWEDETVKSSIQPYFIEDEWELEVR